MQPFYVLGHPVFSPSYPAEQATVAGVFMTWLVAALAPQRVVMVGQAAAGAYFAGCAAAKRLGLTAEFCAVETWRDAEDHAAQAYENTIFSPMSRLADTLDAPDGSVDLLVVAGDALGWETCRALLSPRGVLCVLGAAAALEADGAAGLRIATRADFAQCGLTLYGLGAQAHLAGAETVGFAAEFCAQAERYLAAEALERRVAQAEKRAEQAENALELAQRQGAALAAELQNLRRDPLKQWRNNLAVAVLRGLSKASPPLSQRTARRFARSAEKRDPFARSANGGYAALLKAWRELRAAQREKVSALKQELSNGPRVSLLVDLTGASAEAVHRTLASVQGQSYARWEICFAGEGAPEGPQYRHFASRAEAVSQACGEVIAVLGAGSQLDCDALLLAAAAFVRNPNLGFLYTDEDALAENGERSVPQFKPDWNQDLFYSHDYIGNFYLLRRDLAQGLGAFSPAFQAAWSYDLLLRVIEHRGDLDVEHLAKVLVSHPKCQFDQSRLIGERIALSAHLRRHYKCVMPVEPGLLASSHKIIWPIKGQPLVSIIIPTRDRLSLVRLAVESILERTDYPHYEIIIVDNGSVELETLEWFREIQAEDARVKVRRDPQPFNYSALNNEAVAQSKGEFVALVNNDIEVITPYWLREMVSLAQRPKTGCVGAKLYYPNDTIQHSGVVAGLGGAAGHVHIEFPREDDGYFGRLKLRQNYSVVTAACLLVRRDIYDLVGGLDAERFVVAYNDVDFCLKVREAGFENIWTPYAELTHYESASRGSDAKPENRARFLTEFDRIQKKWDLLNFKDPAFNENLDSGRGDFAQGVPVWNLE